MKAASPTTSPIGREHGSNAYSLMTKITTILPTFERPKLLRRAIESVLAQSIKDFTLCIYDNCSLDETQQVIEEYQKQDSRIRYYRRKRNVGLIENFALALDEVQAPYFSFLSDDDYLLPLFYEIALEGFKNYPDVGFSATRTLTINAKGKLLPMQFYHPFLKGYFPKGSAVEALASTKLFPIWTGILYRTEIMTQIGGLDKNASFAFDMDFTFRYACSSPIVISSKPGAILMKWEKAASTLLDDGNFAHFDVIIENIKKLFIGTTEQKSLTLLKLHDLKRMACKHIWIYGLLSGQIEKAKRAKNFYLSENTSEKSWLIHLLLLTETNLALRKLFCIYFYTSRSFRSLRARLRRNKDSEVHFFICKEKFL